MLDSFQPHLVINLLAVSASTCERDPANLRHLDCPFISVPPAVFASRLRFVTLAHHVSPHIPSMDPTSTHRQRSRKTSPARLSPPF